MMKSVIANPLTAAAFAPFGDVIEKGGGEQFSINRGNCIRHHALATAEVTGDDASVIISIFCGQPYGLPHVLDMVERHPLGSQAFYPLSTNQWLVIVAPDASGKPGLPQAFLARGDQGINLKPGIWHGVLTPLDVPADFLVVDCGGTADNLEEHYFDAPYDVRLL